MTELQDPKPAADRIRFAEDLVESLAMTVVETVPSGTDIALLGGEALAWRWGRELCARLPEHRLVKNDAELDLLRAAGEVGARAVEAAMEVAVLAPLFRLP
jgi:Xaa-Pro aminopeptidase